MHRDDQSADDTPQVPTLVGRALQRCAQQYDEVLRRGRLFDADDAQRCVRLAVICERESRWYGVLHRWVYSTQGTVPLVFGQVAGRAQSCALADTQFWTDRAAQYRARACRSDERKQEER